MKGINAVEFQFILALCCVLLGYLLYWFTAANGDNKPDGVNNSVRIFIKRLVGLGFMGVMPAFLITMLTSLALSQLGVNFRFDIDILLWVFGLGAPIVLISSRLARHPALLADNPQTHNRYWSKGTFILEYGGWAAYLLGYEFLFRGVLFLSLLPKLGLAPAIALNVVVYSFAHLPKGRAETLGSIAFGVILCLATAQTGSIWAAWIIHVILAWSSSFFAFVAHENMQIKKS